MTAAPEALAPRLRERLDLAGISPRKLSLELGANVAYVGQVISGKGGMPSADRLQRMAELLGTTTDYLLGRTENPAQPTSEVSFGEFRQNWRGPPSEKLEVRGTGYCDDLEIEVDGRIERIEQTLFEPGHVIQLIERPPALRGVPGAYAIYFHGSSMEKRFFQGEIGIVSPTPPPGPGDFVVAQLNDGTSEEVVHVLVKQLVRITSAYVEFEQFNPALRFRVDRKRITRMHRILGPTELFTR